MNHWRILLLLYYATVAAEASHTRTERAREVTHPAAPHPKASKRVIGVHVLVHASVSATKELGKGVASTKELFKDGMGITLESVVEGTRATST